MSALRYGLCLLLLCPIAATAEPQTIRLRADSWFPVNGEPRAARPGFGIEVLHEVWTPAGYQIDYQLTPWRRSLDLVYAGASDCVIGAYLSDASEMLFPLEPLAFDGVGLYMLAGKTIDYQGPASLSEQHVGVIGGYSYGPVFDTWLDANGDNPLVEIMQGSEALGKNIRKLLSGRLDVVVESPLVMQAMLEAMNLEGKVHRAASVTGAMPIFVACGPGRGAREWLRVYDEGIRKMRASGKLAEIYSRYGIDFEKQEEMRLSWPGRVHDTISVPAKQ